MSESTGTVDSTNNGTVDTTGTTVPTTLSEEELLEFLTLKAKAQKAKDRAAEAKAERQRANGRPIDPDTGKELAASVAFFQVAATWIENWLTTYRDDPEQLFQRMEMQLKPMLVQMADTPSSLMSNAFDNSRRTMKAWIVPAEVRPTATPPKTNK
jgi:hypothetical protein